MIEYTIHAQSPSPHAIWLHETVENEDKSHILELDLFEGKRSNGDTVSVVTSHFNARDIRFVARGLTVTTNDKNDNIVVYGVGTPMRGSVDGGDDCKNLGSNAWTGETKEILGFKVYNFHSELPDSKDDEWKAPALGCETLERVSYYTKMDGVASDGITHRIAVRAVAVDPPINFFRLPASPSEVSPDEYDLALWGPSHSHSENSQSKRTQDWAADRAVRQKNSITLQ